MNSRNLFVLLIKKAESFFYYTGHGLKDGSLLFVDGSLLSPEELTYHINSFKNDTILMIDACYSGSNDGPRKMKTGLSFKENCWRIYAALAHQTAREDIYNDSFFKTIMPFYREVLGIDTIKGNSYFAALWGVFFATYQFKPDDKLTFRDLVYYISGTSKQYVEFLASKNPDYELTGKKLFNRTNQVPIIYPIGESIRFLNENHKYLIVLKDIEVKNRIDYWLPGNFFSTALGIGFPIPLDPLDNSLEIGIHPLFSFSYNIRWNESIFGVGVITGMNYSSSKEGGDFPGALFMYPAALKLTYCAASPGPIFFQLDCHIGFSILRPKYQDNVSGRTNALGTFFYGSSSMSLGFALTRYAAMVLTGQYIILARKNEINSFISPGISVVYHFQ